MSSCLPSELEDEFRWIVIEMAVLLGSLMRWAHSSKLDRQALEGQIQKRRARIISEITALSGSADFVRSDVVLRFSAQLPDAYLDMLCEGWLPDPVTAKDR